MGLGLISYITAANAVTAQVEQTLPQIADQGIAVAANEGAEGTTNIAQKSAMVVEKSDEVMKQADVSKESSDNLMKMVSKFTV